MDLKIRVTDERSGTGNSLIGRSDNSTLLTSTLAIESSLSSMRSSPINGESQRITSNRSQVLHIRSFGLDSSASDAVPIANNEYCMWSRSENGPETHTEAMIEIRVLSVLTAAGSVYVTY